jgi:hypothetical protein
LTEEQKLIEKLQRIEALFAGATTKGEKVAAANALERIRERLKDVQIHLIGCMVKEAVFGIIASLRHSTLPLSPTEAYHCHGSRSC